MRLLVFRAVVRRLVLPVVLLVIVVTLAFALLRLVPGNPAYVLAGDAPTPELLARINEKYGLNEPLGQQLWIFIAQVARGDLGQSIYYNQPVFEVLRQRFPATLLLAVTALILAVFWGVPLAVWSAQRANTVADTLLSVISLVGYSVPVFWGGQLLILIFAVHLNLLPAGGMGSARHATAGFDQLIELGRHLVLPAVTLAAFVTAMIARFTRAAMIEALDQDYITVARAKGVPERRVVWHHAFRNAAVTTVTVIGLEFGSILAGAAVVEIVFGWPGIGRLFYDAIYRRDFPLLIGAFVFTAALVVIVNALTDLVCNALDPRIRKAEVSL